MQVMLLAAGRGTRLGELGLRIPKALVPVAGRPLLAHQLDYLEREGVETVVVNAHHLADQIVDFVARQERTLDLQVVVEGELLGSAGGLRNALDRFDPSRPILALNADTLLAAPLADVLAAHEASRALATVATAWTDDTTGKGVVDADEAGRVLRFREKPQTAAPGWINAGLYVFEPCALERLEAGAFADIALDLLPPLVEGGSLQALRLDVAPFDIGTPDALARAAEAIAPAEAA